MLCLGLTCCVCHENIYFLVENTRKQSCEYSITLYKYILYVDLSFDILDSCEYDAFYCDAQRCVSYNVTCDTFKDCTDGTDEMNCRTQIFESCQEWFDAGYTLSGSYVIG